MDKKVLIITYYWPPAGGPGVQRWLKFTKYLPDFNIEPIVYVPETNNYPIIDESLVSKIPHDITVLKHPIKEPYKLARVFSKNTVNTISKGVISESKKQGLMEKLLLFVRGNFFIPDARKSWIKPSVEFLSEYILNANIQTVITTGPPHSLHLIGMQLKERLGVKWLADFRDPWTTIGYYKELKLTKTSHNKHKSLEKQVLNSADQIIVTSSVTKDEFEQITNKPIAVITNGYDNESVEHIDLDSKFSISHIGSLLSKRNPEILWKVLADLIADDCKFSEHLQLTFVGVISESIIESIKKHNLIDYVNNVGYLSHNESIKYQKKSQVLLLVEIDSVDTKSIIPGKLFEYMVSNRPIIAIGPEGSDIENIIKETNTGNYFLYNDYDELRTVILNHYQAFCSGTLKSNAIGLQKYHRKSLTKTLSELI